ncbi:FAD-dependent oxidoreductase [Edaphobacter sp. 12200R-103]|uniref:FAD-dependent oxidoreductase n=1 Tax=Edaphobacter sp. 12200R-103 TaxID=2703788 RepID=UPI00138C112B|nr:FAD-dependent oxidoreductase [Edaphobacter sp. 12200R-103]QHS50450.1 FAD-dependent oxidoreductase [Edaphobacter sp. 12200R-103]
MFTKHRSLLHLAVVTFFASTATLSVHAAPTSADFVVYGGTASGVVTAYAAAREGLHVILLEPGTHLGGMVTGGLSATDVAYFQIIGGYARDFYREAAAQYGVHTLNKHGDWLSEPKVGEAIFNDWLKKAGVEVHFHERLKEHGGVSRSGLHVRSITTEDGKIWQAKIFADCSYEGDLMAQAGVKYTVGREGTEVYNEDLAGVRVDTPKHQFLWKISPYNDKGKLMPEVDPGPMGENGSGDKKVQSYNFRLILTNDPANKLPWTKPRGYNSAQFELLAKYLGQWKEKMHREPRLGDVMNPVAIPNKEADFNNNGAFSTDFIGHSWTYPDASYAERRKIWDAHMLYTQSFLWFLASDPRVPKPLQDEVNTWGRAKDEFRDTDGWPNQLYIREGRRMVGMYVMKQSDLQTNSTKPDSIAMGSYNSDSHNIQRVAMPDGSVRNEGDVQVAVKPYEIAFGTILPKKDQTDNLLVPVCLSASHVAYSSVRMEPQYMMMGQAAGVTAALAIQEKTSVQDVSIKALQTKLRSQKAILHLDQETTGTGVD